MSLPQYRLLVSASLAPQRASELADSLGVSRPTLAALADGLEHAGLVKRVPEPTDRRGIRLELTEAGRQATERAEVAVTTRFLSLAEGDVTELLEMLSGSIVKLGSALDAEATRPWSRLGRPHARVRRSGRLRAIVAGGMASENLFSILAEGYAGDPSAPCLELHDGSLRSFGDIDLESAQLAARLAREGVGVGDRVLVQAEKSARVVSLYLACLRRGAIYVPLNTAYTEREVASFLSDALPALFVCDPGREVPASERGAAALATLDASGNGSLVDDLARDADPTVAACASDGLAALLYTSGTTGRSKGAMLSHHNLASNARTLHSCWAFEPGDVLLHVLPLYHAHGLFVALHTALLNGSRILFEERFDAEAVAQRLPDASVFMGVPTHYVRLLERPELSADTCRGMRLFVSGSAPLLAETHRAFELRSGHRILERYGMTETGMITSNPYDGERVPGSVGYALRDVDVRVSRSDGTRVPAGEIGVLEVRGPNVFSGYWRMPEKTQEELRDDGFFVTGDLAEQAPDGRITLVGRAKDLVISGGLNVYPKEIESFLDSLPSVLESAVIGVPHADFGEGVTAVVVPEPGASPDEGALLEALDGHIARFKQPKRIFFVDTLPRNAMGKVQKNLLRDRYADAYQS